MVGFYLLLCVLAPLLVKFFRPLNLRRPLILHSFVCSALSLYSLSCFLLAFYNNADMFSIQEGGPILKHAILIFWISKWYELLDTVFMILRHKKRQISFLHVFHHSTVLLLADYAYNHAAWPALLPMGALNSFVHVVMYGYYGVTAIYPLTEFSFKQRITQLQMLQFMLATVQDVWGYLYYRYCIYSVLYPMAMMALFANFYYQAYIRKRPTESRDAEILKKRE